MDAFEELGLERDLGVTEEVLRERYDRGSGERHPDGGGTREGFAELREAYEVLRSPAKRLRHWLELEGGELPKVGMVPEGVMGVFGEVGGLLQRVGEVRVRKDEARTALVRSMVEREGMGLAEELEEVRGRVVARREEIMGSFGRFQEEGYGACREAAEEAAAELSFLEKWEGQLQEAWVGLAMG